MSMSAPDPETDVTPTGDSLGGLPRLDHLLSAATDLDPLDTQLMELLRANGRESFRQLSVLTGAPEATVRKRVRRLLDDHKVQIVAVPAIRQGNQLHIASVRLAVSGREPAEIAEEISQWPETAWVAVGFGTRPVLAEVVGHDRSDLWDVVSRMYTVAGVSEVEQTVLTKTYKQLYAGPTRP